MSEGTTVRYRDHEIELDKPEGYRSRTEWEVVRDRKSQMTGYHVTYTDALAEAKKEIDYMIDGGGEEDEDA